MSKVDKAEDSKKETILYKREIPERPHRGFSKREIEERKEAMKRVSTQTLSYRFKNHQHWFPRMLYKIGNGVWLVVVSVGGFIAWLIGTLFI